MFPSITYYRVCLKKVCVVAAVIDSLFEAKEVAGTLTGRQGGTATFIPHVYSKAQSEWVNNFYKQNGYIGELILYLTLLLSSEGPICSLVNNTGDMKYILSQNIDNFLRDDKE